MEKEGYWMVRTVRSGDVIEKSQFWFGQRKPRSDRKKGSTSAKKKDQNMVAAVRRLARVINCNFRRGDILLTLDYDNEHLPADRAEADRQAAALWRRLKREIKAAGAELRGFWITADKDEKTGKTVRLHHHLVMRADAVKMTWDGGKPVSCTIGGRELRELWKNGHADVEPLKTQQDYTPLAAYLVRQAAGDENARKWHPSRNLLKPVIEDERFYLAPRQLRAPGGATVSEIGHYDELTGNHYIRYIRKPKKRRKTEDELSEIPGDLSAGEYPGTDLF